MDKRTLCKLEPKNIAFKNKVHELFNVLNSYTKTGIALGISRQRVHQIITGYNTYKRKKINSICVKCRRNKAEAEFYKDKNYLDKSGLMLVCNRCKIKLTWEADIKSIKTINCPLCNKEVTYRYRMKIPYCKNCSLLIKSHTKKPNLKYHIRSINYPDKCTTCGINIVGTKRSRGMCRKCYHRWLYKNSPNRRLQSAASTKKWLKNNPDKAKELRLRAQKRHLLRVKADPVRLKKYKETLKRAAKTYQKKNREKVNEYHRMYYHKAKLSLPLDN